MASTRNLLASAKFALPFMSYQPIQIAGDDPAISAANLVKQTVLGAPFDWRWNRTEMLLPLLVGQQDYAIVAPAFGFLSRVTLRDQTLFPPKVTELSIQTSLSLETITQRPQSVAAQLDDNLGNITLRFNTVPDKIYVATVLFQHKALPMTSMASTWGPIPDELAYIYDWGFLSILSMLVKDARMPLFRQMFLSHLVGAQDGLDETKRNLFLGNFLDLLTSSQRAQAKVSQGMAARQI